MNHFCRSGSGRHRGSSSPLGSEKLPSQRNFDAKGAIQGSDGGVYRLFHASVQNESAAGRDASAVGTEASQIEM